MITRGPRRRNCEAQTLFKKGSLGKPKGSQDTTTQGHQGSLWPLTPAAASDEKRSPTPSQVHAGLTLKAQVP